MAFLSISNRPTVVLFYGQFVKLDYMLVQFGVDIHSSLIPGVDPGFQVRGGAHLKLLRRAEGGAKMFGVFRVKNFTPKKYIFSNFRGGGGGAPGAPAPEYICILG